MSLQVQLQDVTATQTNALLSRQVTPARTADHKPPLEWNDWPRCGQMSMRFAGRYCSSPVDHPRHFVEVCVRERFVPGRQEFRSYHKEIHGICPINTYCHPAVDENGKGRIGCVDEVTLHSYATQVQALVAATAQHGDTANAAKAFLAALAERPRPSRNALFLHDFLSVADLQELPTASMDHTELGADVAPGEAPIASVSTELTLSREMPVASISAVLEDVRTDLELGASSSTRKRKTIEPAHGDFSIRHIKAKDAAKDDRDKGKGRAEPDEDARVVCEASTSTPLDLSLSTVCQPTGTLSIAPGDVLKIHFAIPLELSLAAVVKIFTLDVGKGS